MRAALLVIAAAALAVWLSVRGAASEGESAPTPTTQDAVQAANEHDAAPTEVVDVHADCRARIDELKAELRRESELRLEREREWLRYTQRMALLTQLAGAPTFQPDVPSDERESRALAAGTGPSATASSEALREESSATAGDAAVSDAPDPSLARLERAARLARQERSRAVFLALRSLFAIEHVSGLDLLESGLVGDGATGPVVLRVIDERGRPLGSLYAERMRLEGSHAARTLSLILEHGWERRGGTKTAFEGGPVDMEGRGGVRRIELAHVDPTPWFEALPELFREDQREAVTQGDPQALTTLRFELNRRLRTDASGSVYRLESLSAVQGLVLREVHLSVLTPDMLLERELFADRMSILRAEKGLEIVLQDGSQIRGSGKVPFLDGRYRIFLPRADAGIWTELGIPLGRRAEAVAEPVPPRGQEAPAAQPAGDSTGG